MTPEQHETVERVREYLKDELSSMSREAVEAERAVWTYYPAMAPGPSYGDNLFIDDAVASAWLDAGAYDAAVIMAAELLESGKPLPPSLAEFTSGVLRGTNERPNSGKGRRGLTDLRNHALAHAVWMLEVAGIPATKAVESARICGCDIVAGIYDELLANDASGEYLKPKGGEFSAVTMKDIWLRDKEVLSYRKHMSNLPD